MTERNHLIVPGATLGGAIAYAFGADLKVIGLYTAAGGLYGLAACEIASAPNPTPIGALAAKVDDCRSKIEQKFSDTFGEPLPSLSATLELGAVFLLGFYLMNKIVKLDDFDSAIVSAGGTLVLAFVRYEYFPGPQ